MLAPFAKHGHKRPLRPQTTSTPAPTHDEILLNFAQEVLKYEQAQLNIHFAFIGLTGPCPCDDCRNVLQYPAEYFLRARQEVRRAEEMKARAAEATRQLEAARARQAEADFRLIDRVEDALTYGAMAELLAEDTHLEEIKDKVKATGIAHIGMLRKEIRHEKR